MNYYAEAVEMCSEEQNWKKVVIDIAKKHPKCVVEAIAGSTWKVEARKLYLEQGEKIKAIKHCRAMTGMGLKEAKEAVEALGV
jgi:ribosomal protein L7/L12